MSANNFMAVEKNYDTGQWEVWIRDADTGDGYVEKRFFDELKAFRWATNNDITEYGLKSTPSKSKNIKAK